MKHPWKIFMAIVALTLLALLVQSCQAQDAATAAAATGSLQAVLDGITGKYGWLVNVLMIIGTLRVVLKPFMAAVESSVARDPARAAALQTFEAGPVFKTVAFLLDITASIKLPQTIIASTTPKTSA